MCILERKITVGRRKAPICYTATRENDAKRRKKAPNCYTATMGNTARLQKAPNIAIPRRGEIGRRSFAIKNFPPLKKGRGDFLYGGRRKSLLSRKIAKTKIAYKVPVSPHFTPIIPLPLWISRYFVSLGYYPLLRAKIAHIAQVTIDFSPGAIRYPCPHLINGL